MTFSALLIDKYTHIPTLVKFHTHAYGHTTSNAYYFSFMEAIKVVSLMKHRIARSVTSTKMSHCEHILAVLCLFLCYGSCKSLSNLPIQIKCFVARASTMQCLRHVCERVKMLLSLTPVLFQGSEF